MVVGRITLFHVESEHENPAYFRGTIEYQDGTKESVTLWEHDNSRVTGGKYYSGTINDKVEQ